MMPFAKESLIYIDKERVVYECGKRGWAFILGANFALNLIKGIALEVLTVQLFFLPCQGVSQCRVKWPMYFIA